jgi:hypothetical protein
VGSSGIEGLMLETHNWGKSVAFWQGLGFELEFETDHNSGQLRHPNGGPWLFIAEIPEGQPVEMQPVLQVDDAEHFEPPSAGTVERDFEEQHWQVLEMVVRDPDGRRFSVQAPLAKTAS